jgi:hypothetical protein
VYIYVRDASNHCLESLDGFFYLRNDRTNWVRIASLVRQNQLRSQRMHMYVQRQAWPHRVYGSICTWNRCIPPTYTRRLISRLYFCSACAELEPIVDCCLPDYLWVVTGECNHTTARTTWTGYAKLILVPYVRHARTEAELISAQTVSNLAATPPIGPPSRDLDVDRDPSCVYLRSASILAAYSNRMKMSMS